MLKRLLFQSVLVFIMLSVSMGIVSAQGRGEDKVKDKPQKPMERILELLTEEPEPTDVPQPTQIQNQILPTQAPVPATQVIPTVTPTLVAPETIVPTSIPVVTPPILNTNDDVEQNNEEKPNNKEKKITISQGNTGNISNSINTERTVSEFRDTDRDNDKNGFAAISDDLGDGDGFLTIDTDEDRSESNNPISYIIPDAVADGLGHLNLNYYLGANIDPETNYNLILAVVFFVALGYMLVKFAPRPKEARPIFQWSRL